MKTLNEARKELKTLGYKIKIKKYSDFIAASVFDREDKQVNGGNIFPKNHLEKYSQFYQWQQENKGKIFDGFSRVVF